jgi:hypothetical protein
LRWTPLPWIVTADKRRDWRAVILPEALSLTGEEDWSRREFALSVQPASAQSITTDDKGLTTGEVRVPTVDGQMPAYRAMPP